MNAVCRRIRGRRSLLRLLQPRTPIGMQSAFRTGSKFYCSDSPTSEGASFKSFLGGRVGNRAHRTTWSVHTSGIEPEVVAFCCCLRPGGRLSDSQVQARQICGCLYLFLLRPPPQARRGDLSACAGHRPGAGPGGGLYREHADVRSNRRRFGDSKRSSHRLQVHLREIGFTRIAHGRMSYRCSRLTHTF